MALATALATAPAKLRPKSRLAASNRSVLLTSRRWILVTRAPSSPDKPRVGITIGDPAGIGPEIVLKAVAEPEVRAVCSPVIVGDAAEIRRQASELGRAASFNIVTTEQLADRKSVEPVVFDTGKTQESVRWGALSASSGRAAITAIEGCVNLCLAGHLEAMTTAPINKGSLKLAGSPFP